MNTFNVRYERNNSYESVRVHDVGYLYPRGCQATLSHVRPNWEP